MVRKLKAAVASSGSQVGLEGVHLSFEECASPRLWNEITTEEAADLLEKMTVVCTMDWGVIVAHRGLHQTQGWMIVIQTIGDRCAVIHGHLLPTAGNG